MRLSFESFVQLNERVDKRANNIPAPNLKVESVRIRDVQPLDVRTEHLEGFRIKLDLWNGLGFASKAAFVVTFLIFDYF